jgi:16S rRNA G966 N2-methylase RsmD
LFFGAVLKDAPVLLLACQELDGRYVVFLAAINGPLARRDAIFAQVPVERRSELCMDDVAQYSASEAACADATSRWMLQLLEAATSDAPARFRVTDACACVGGNTLSFARHMAQVQAVECDAGFLEMLRRNCAVADATNIAFFAHDYVALLASLAGTQDAVFVDPPWGGPGYERVPRLTVCLDEAIAMPELCRRVRAADQNTTAIGARTCNLLVFKLPTNANIDAFVRDLAKDAIMPLLACVRLPRMFLLTVAYAPQLTRSIVRAMLAGARGAFSREAGAAKALMREAAWHAPPTVDHCDESSLTGLADALWEHVPDAAVSTPLDTQ